MDLEKQYKIAREVPGITAQEFLEFMDYEDVGKYFSDVVCLHRNVPGYHQYARFNCEAITIPSKLVKTFGIKGTKSRLILTKKGFNQENLGDLLSIIIDHEGFHAREFYENPRKIIVPKIDFWISEKERMVRKIASEIRAYQNQVNKFKDRDTSKEFEEDILRMLEFQKEELEIAKGF
jgi:hypothetical protein